MDKYEVLGLLGEGSFGRVYKAKQICDSKTVAFKVISKRGRSMKEIKGLRRECEIQRHLHHPNIIQMLDSFETENEIVVITEFAHKELTVVLSKEGYLSEDRVQTIVWDLVSALYYLHSHRVLHRDLKPQNILLNSKNNAKLCDFGFARNMSTGTHVLTSIKGTPLYMAPELIEEHPYDHSADLWSLGCITYELLVGAPPFCTTSILHLIRMIRHEQIQFPTLISESCISFLKGLLQKDPTKRLSWPDILKHPFMKGHVLILDDGPSKPLTRPLSINTLQAKERQRKNCLTQKGNTNGSSCKHNQHKDQALATAASIVDNEKKCCALEEESEIEENLACLCMDGKRDTTTSEVSCQSQEELKEKIETNRSTEVEKSKINFNLNEDFSPIENEEWEVFMQRTIEEVISGETTLSQASLAIFLLSPMRNASTSSKVVGQIATLFSLPFVVPGNTKDILEQIKQVYIDIKLIPNLVYASKLLHNTRNEDFASNYTDEDFLAIERIYVLICHLVHVNNECLSQFCDSIVVLSIYNFIRQLLTLTKKRMRIVTDTIAILTLILRIYPENANLIVQILNCKSENGEVVNFTQLLRNSHSLLRERSCYFLQVLGKTARKTLEGIWSDVMRDTLEALVYDSMENVRNAAEVTVEELKRLSFYKVS